MKEKFVAEGSIFENNGLVLPNMKDKYLYMETTVCLLYSTYMQSPI